ncbi:MAG: Asparagine synthetase [glutamine-hydrolyzing] (EC [uncultured Thiotrichaceae bacterium]|uniref:asparagine synthase (glutamine-hydrolyzing) n=1 Tax=uncultured Thiotrichaceae bacterium TaxID=298394 RepID=A0A6S6TGH4_9GAMM|nr:MAG: Asparagine synthetase [glutamine-hydrolyzing] (EC [uncultured Thiotrichaceae bacterium]
MCGIAGFIDFNKKSSEDDLQKMTDVLHYRGPDDSGYFFSPSEHSQIGLGHRRLSILDLSPLGHQPMHFEHLHIVFNGEVYNFAEIREELIKEGYSFTSDSDTEVILKSFHCWGIKAVDKYNGMFAFSIYDEKTQKITLVRDRSGVKPLYWYHKDNLILFSSELKSFHQHPAFEKAINTDALAQFLNYKYVPEPHCIFQHCRKLGAGHYLEIDLATGETHELTYWNVLHAYNKPVLKISEQEAIEELDSLMLSAFNYRMVADVPVGIFLSGGYDSSLVTGMLQTHRTEQLKTYTIGFHEKGFDEAPYAKQVAQHLGTDHTEYYCTQDEAKAILPGLANLYDEPFADSSAIPTVLVSQLARKEVTVSLSADGGDELFAGYEKHSRVLDYHKRFASKPAALRNTASSLMGLINPDYIPVLNKTQNFSTKYDKLRQILGSKDILDVLKITSQEFSELDLKRLFKDMPKTAPNNFDLQHAFNDHPDDLGKMLAIDYKTYMLDDILTKVDRATMSVSLEGREPLLDYRLIEYIARLPSNMKYRDGVKKYLLKEITHRYLPREIMDRPKMGFGVPMTEWFRDELKVYFTHYLTEERLDKAGIFNTAEIIGLRDRYLAGARENSQKLWSLLMFEMWYEQWME